MSHLRIWQALIGCVIALAGLLGCQSSATKQGIRVDPTLWLRVSSVPGMPLLDQEVPPTETFDVTREGTVRRTIDDAARGNAALSPEQLRELQELIVAVDSTYKGIPLDASGVVLKIYGANGMVTQVEATQEDGESVPVRVQRKLQALFPKLD